MDSMPTRTARTGWRLVCLETLYVDGRQLSVTPLMLMLPTLEEAVAAIEEVTGLKGVNTQKLSPVFHAFSYGNRVFTIETYTLF